MTMRLIGQRDDCKNCSPSQTQLTSDIPDALR